MSKRTVTPVTDPGMLAINFAGAKIAGIGRVDPKSASCTFHCSLGRGIGKLFETMGWEVPGEKSSYEKLDGKLEGGNFIFTSVGETEKLKVKSGDGKVNTEAEVDIDFGTITKFTCHRLEIEGRKKKGFRRELRFEATVKNEDGMALLEGYMMQTDNARGSLKVSYVKEAEQTEIPTDDGQPSLITEEQRNAASEDED